MITFWQWQCIVAFKGFILCEPKVRPDNTNVEMDPDRSVEKATALLDDCLHLQYN